MEDINFVINGMVTARCEHFFVVHHRLLLCHNRYLHVTINEII